MHVISNERALAHWQALNRLPDTALNLLKTRFLREQPLLASVVLPLTNGLISDTNGQERIPDSNDPTLDDFWRLTTTGAIMSEIFCREAGRPLRPLDEPDVAALVEESTNLFEQSNVGKKTAHASTPNLFKSCSQPNLFSGAAAAHFADEGLAREELPREILTLRILVQGLHRACGDEPAASLRSWDAERIQFALSTQGDPSRREALAASDTFRAELAPNLIKELEWWAAEPEAALEVDGSLGIHALYLLARWRETPAWPIFRQLFSLPGDIGYDLLGDLITEDGSILLAMMGGQRREDLRAMVEDEKLDEYCRNACLDALTCLVAWDELPRAEHIAYLRDLLTTKLRDVAANGHVLGGVVSAVCDLEAWELEPEVGTAFTRGVVREDFIDMGFFLDAKAGKYRNQWQAFCDRHRPITDVPVATAWMDEPPKDEPPFDDDMDAVASSATPYVAPPKTGRNDPCPCGSGKKYKKCCGR